MGIPQPEPETFCANELVPARENAPANPSTTKYFIKAVMIVSPVSDEPRSSPAIKFAVMWRRVTLMEVTKACSTAMSFCGLRMHELAADAAIGTRQQQ
jgi:hypothetical protein